MISKLRRQYNLVQFSPICGGWWVSGLTTQSDQAWPPPAPATTHPPARPGEPEFIINNYSNRWTENLPPANSQSLSAIPSVINNFHLQFLDFALHSVVWCGALERSAWRVLIILDSMTFHCTGCCLLSCDRRSIQAPWHPGPQSTLGIVPKVPPAARAGAPLRFHPGATNIGKISDLTPTLWSVSLNIFSFLPVSTRCWGGVEQR